MPQKQNEVPLIVLEGYKRKAIATGNNATWFCRCEKREMPLIGRSGSIKGASPRMIVECPECGRRFFVVPTDKNYGRVKEVRELHNVSFN